MIQPIKWIAIKSSFGFNGGIGANMEILDGTGHFRRYLHKLQKIQKLDKNPISKVLAELKAHEQVECINPEVGKR